MLLLQSLGCVCGDGKHVHGRDGKHCRACSGRRAKHERARRSARPICTPGCAVCEGVPCVEFRPSPLRTSLKHPNLKEFWRRVRELAISDDAAGILISGAYSYAGARLLQDNTAIVRKGGEIPAHTELKRSLEKVGDTSTLSEIKNAEADRKAWSDRKLRRHLQALEKQLSDILNSAACRARLPSAFLKSADTLHRRTKEVNAERRDLKQTEMQKCQKDEALAQMALAVGSGHWDLIGLAVVLASSDVGHSYEGEVDSLRSEYRGLPRRLVARVGKRYGLPLC